MTVLEYQTAVENNQRIIDFEGKLVSIPIIITPNWEDGKYDFLKNLGTQPYEITTNETELFIHYPGGRVEYYLESERGMMVPSLVTVFGVQVEDGKTAINTEIFDTTMTFSQVAQDDNQEGDSYIDFGFMTLRMDLHEGEKRIPNDWWIGEKKG